MFNLQWTICSIYNGHIRVQSQSHYCAQICSVNKGIFAKKNKMLHGFFVIQQPSFKSFRDIMKKNYKKFLSTHFYDLRIKGGN